MATPSLSQPSFRTPTGVLAAIGDPEGTRAISSIIALLVVLGIGLVMLAVWLFRVTRPDPEVLAPLELMGERTWRRADPVWQRRRLDEVRPAGAEPLEPSAAPPDIDEAFDDGPPASGFDDLQEDQVPPDPVQQRLPMNIPGEPLAVPPVTNTPTGMARPVIEFDDDGDLDPDLLAAAMADLDAELHLGHDRAHGGAGD